MDVVPHVLWPCHNVMVVLVVRYALLQACLRAYHVRGTSAGNALDAGVGVPHARHISMPRTHAHAQY